MMNLIDKINGVVGFGVYEKLPMCVYGDYFTVDDKFFSKSGSDYIYTENGILVLYNHDNDQFKIYNNGDFEMFNRTFSSHRYFTKDIWLEYNDDDYNNIAVRLVEYGQLYSFNMDAPNGIHWPKYDKNNSILFFSEPREKYILFYTKTGQRLWECKEEDDNLKINGRCIPIVDDVVVVISQEITAAMKLQGFDIRTGKILWQLDVSERVCPNTFFIGEDKMLYGCEVFYGDTLELNLCKLNPATGELQSWGLLSDDKLDVMPWLVTMHGNKLYYTDNRRGNEIGVIDVDKKEQVERVPLNIDKKVTIGAPVVTDDKVYVFIQDLQELRVYEK